MGGIARILRACLLEGPALFALIWLSGFLFFVWTIPSKPENDPAKTDAIVVLTGGQLRVQEGLKLLEDGRAPYLFISGVGEGVKLKDLLIANGVTAQEADSVHASTIYLGREAATTNGNALETAEWVTKNKIKSIRLVTANYHMRRSLLELKAVMPKLEILPHPVFPDQQQFANWWKDADATIFLAGEYNKYLLALVFVKLDGGRK